MLLVWPINSVNYKKAWLILPLLFISLMGCRAQAVPSDENATLNNPPLEIGQVTVVPQSSTPVLPSTNTPQITLTSNLTQTLELRHIVSADVRMIEWSSDSQRLFASGGGFDYYDVQEGVFKTFSEDSEMPIEPQAEILFQLPPYHHVYVSPSGNRAVYIRLEDALPTLTPDPKTEGGESPPLCGPREVWLWKNDRAYSLGKINHCSFGQHIWSPDEQKVVLVEFGIPMIAGPEAQAWLIDLEQQIPYPLFPREDYPPLQVYGFTPDGYKLLHGFFSDLTGANLSLLTVDSLQSQPLDMPIHGLPGNAFIYPTSQWIHEDKILVQYGGDATVPPYPVVVLNINTAEFFALTTMFPNKYIAYAVLSPNRRWLAFTTGEMWFPQDDLWLLEVNLDR